jgi:predicted nucleotidyltransferase
MEDKFIEEEFILVKPKNKKKNDLKKFVLTFDETIEIIKMILIKYNVYSAFLYGSYARKQQNFNDIDILVIWKNNIPYNIRDIKEDIRSNLNYPIDICNMIYIGKLIEYDNKCKYFIEDNVYQDAVNIFVHKKHIILESKYIGKI